MDENITKEIKKLQKEYKKAQEQNELEKAQEIENNLNKIKEPYFNRFYRNAIGELYSLKDIPQSEKDDMKDLFNLLFDSEEDFRQLEIRKSKGQLVATIQIKNNKSKFLDNCILKEDRKTIYYISKTYFEKDITNRELTEKKRALMFKDSYKTLMVVLGGANKEELDYKKEHIIGPGFDEFSTYLSEHLIEYLNNWLSTKEDKKYDGKYNVLFVNAIPFVTNYANNNTLYDYLMKDEIIQDNFKELISEYNPSLIINTSKAINNSDENRKIIENILSNTFPKATIVSSDKTKLVEVEK